MVKSKTYTPGMLDYIHYNIMTLNNSKYFAGIVMIMLNLGSRFITIEFSESQKALMQNSLIRQLLIFSVAWMGTRDIYTALNESSKFCILPDRLKKFKKSIDINNDGKLTDDEINRAINILKQSKK